MRNGLDKVFRENRNTPCIFFIFISPCVIIIKYALQYPAITHKYALHILNNQHEFGPAHNTIKLIKQCSKHRNLLLWENFHIQNYGSNHQLINEQSKPEYNILYDLHTYNYAQPHSATYTPRNTGTTQSVSDRTQHGTHTISK